MQLIQVYHVRTITAWADIRERIAQTGFVNDHLTLKGFIRESGVAIQYSCCKD